MRRVDIVMVKPGNQNKLYGELSSYGLTAIEPPLWAALLAAYLRKLGYQVVLHDAEAENWTYAETAQVISAIKPLLVAVTVSGSNPSASTMNMSGAGKIVSMLKELDPSIRIVLTGLHPSALPERTLREEKSDFVCQGEGFETLPKLINSLRSNACDYKIPGLWYRQNGIITSNEIPAPIKNLDELPIPAWDMLPMAKYRAHNWHCFDDISHRSPYAIIYTSLGCPFRCNFCCINALFSKNTIRYRSLNAVVEEIDYLVNTFGIRNIKIIDEMFALNEKRVTTLCDLIIERGYDLNMWAYARVNTVTPIMLEKMKAAGINWVAYGFESGNKRVIENVSKGYRMDLVEDVVQMTYKLDMHICANFIFGLPEDDYDSMNDTLKLMLDINAEWSNIYSAMAYPGSQLYNFALENKWQLPETWDSFSQYTYDSLPLPTKYLTSGQVLGFRDYAFNTYYQNPRYLNMIKNKFGKDTVLHIQDMAKKALPRKYAQF